MTNKILITSALPYANGPLHFGHIAGAYLPGDCYARFQRLRGQDVLYICGSDEHGVAITLSAEIAGRTPQEHVDIFHEVNKRFFQRLRFSFDHYSRTTWKGHVEPTQRFFLDLLKNGYIEEKEVDHLYSEADGKFLADRYVEGTCPRCGFENARGDECPKCGSAYEATDLIHPRSKLTKAALVLKPSRHWYLCLDKFRDQLTQWLESKSWKPNVTNFARQYIKDLRPRAITRDSHWGVPVPLEGTEGKVLYVWFDAPIGYISATMEWAQLQGTPERWRDYWCESECKLVNFVGKDNIPFHAVIFPAMTMGQDQPYKLVDELPANEFYNLEGRQFSKSEGWYIDLEEFFTHYTADQIRYAIAANAPETSDSEFTWKDFQSRCNSDLLGKYGNFANRTLVFAQKHCQGQVPTMNVLEPIDEEFLAKVDTLVKEIADAYEGFHLRRASQLVMELATAGNVYFDAKAPWKDVKDQASMGRMETTIACCLLCLKTLALTSSPIVPDAAQQLWQLLGLEGELDQEGRWEFGPLLAHSPLPQPKVLFRKVEDEEVQRETARLEQLSEKARNRNKAEVAFEPLKNFVDIQDFRKLDLRVGMILDAVKIPKASNLLKLHVDLGMEKRIVVAGIRNHYQEADLIGRKVVVVANLKPARIMGVDSQGMLLAANFDDGLELVGLHDMPPGSLVS